uniref:Calcineurin-like phosphoesterase domain-containing protein n=2 Tax=Auxenochlorella protothecoides TaxID=3075 RepID=A0A1D2A0W5_AUXPR
MPEPSRYETLSIEQKGAYAYPSNHELDTPELPSTPTAPLARPRAVSCRTRTGVLIAILVVLVFLVWEVALFINNDHLKNAARGDSPIHTRFLAVGDWGRDGKHNQSLVASAMALKAATFQPDFIVSTGDNFYQSGLVWPEDPQFNTSFIDIYSQPGLQLPWYAVLGNHDYGELKDDAKPDDQPPVCSSLDSESCYYSPLHQLSQRLVARDWRWRCERAFQLPLAPGALELFFIDTNPMMSYYRDTPWAGHKGGILDQSLEAQLVELEAALFRSSARWKIVIGHHPIYSNQRDVAQPQGYYKDTKRIIEPLLEKYGVQAYIHGHDHSLYHIVPANSSYHQYCSGAGSKLSQGFLRDGDAPFQRSLNGFIAVEVGSKRMTVEFIGLESEKPLYTHVIHQ